MQNVTKSVMDYTHKSHNCPTTWPLVGAFICIKPHNSHNTPIGVWECGGANVGFGVGPESLGILGKFFDGGQDGMGICNFLHVSKRSELMDGKTYDQPEPEKVTDMDMAIVKMHRTGEVGVIVTLGDHEMFLDLETTVDMCKALNEIVATILVAAGKVHQPAEMVQ
jgi:hypothetical protein